MPTGLTPIRRVVTGNDARGHSKVVWDGPAPNAHEGSMGSGRGHTDLWVWTESPAPLSGDHDDGNLKYAFSGPAEGGHFRVVQARARPADYNRAKDKNIVPVHLPKLRPGSRGTWDRGGNNAYSSAMHKTETVDYGIVLAGERELILDDRKLVMKPGDVVIQVGAWHQWSMPKGAMMAFDMIAARFADGPAGLAQGHDKPMRAAAKLPAGVKPTRRIVTIDRKPGKSSLVGDGPAPDVRSDPARPGYACARLWVTDSPPRKSYSRRCICRTPSRRRRAAPSAGSSPPHQTKLERQGRSRRGPGVFRAMGSPGASSYSPLAPTPTCRRRAPLISASCWKARSCWCWTHRKCA